MPASQIHDGYTLTAKTPSVLGLPAIEFRYRPALPDAVFEYLSASRLTGKAYLHNAKQLLGKYVVSWDLTDKVGNPISVGAAAIDTLPYQVIESMVGYIVGYSFDEQQADVKN